MWRCSRGALAIGDTTLCGIVCGCLLLGLWEFAFLGPPAPPSYPQVTTIECTWQDKQASKQAKTTQLQGIDSQTIHAVHTGQGMKEMCACRVCLTFEANFVEERIVGERAVQITSATHNHRHTIGRAHWDGECGGAQQPGALIVCRSLTRMRVSRQPVWDRTGRRLHGRPHTGPPGTHHMH